MQIQDGIEIVDLALFIKKPKILIIADVHIGYEESLNKQGIFVPRFQFRDVMERLEKILKKTKPKTIVVNGDLKHEFGTISTQEWRETLQVLDLLQKYGKVILLKGNHDTILGPIAKKKEVNIQDFFFFESIYICHGHLIPESKIFKSAKTIIIGHEHPAIALQEFARAEKYKCFLKGRWKQKNLIVMPSFNLVTDGTDITKELLLNPFLKQDISGFEVYAVADKIYRFPKLRDIEL